MISTKTLLHGAIALISIDIIFTLVAVGGMGAIELNPLFHILGISGFMAIKIFFSIIAVAVMYKYVLPVAPISARYGSLVLIASYGLVCASNMYHVIGAVT